MLEKLEGIYIFYFLNFWGIAIFFWHVYKAMSNVWMVLAIVCWSQTF